MLSAAGDGLLYSTFLGGSPPEAGQAIALDGAGSIYIAGFAYSGFPTLRPYQSYQGYSDAFVTKMGPPPPASLWTLVPCRVANHALASGPAPGVHGLSTATGGSEPLRSEILLLLSVQSRVRSGGPPGE